MLRCGIMINLKKKNLEKPEQSEIKAKNRILNNFEF